MKTLFVEHFTEILALIGGTLLPLIFTTTKNVVLGKAKTQKETIKEILDKNILLSQKVERLQSEISNLTIEYERRLRDLEIRYFEKNLSLKREIDGLRNQLILFESSSNDTPLISWLADEKNVIVWVNKVYEDTLLTPDGLSSEDIIGQNITQLIEKDNKFTPEQVARYKANNEAVLKNGVAVYDVETLFVNGEKKEYFVIKHPRRFGNKIVGISGSGIELNIILNLLNSYENEKHE
jgi:PAS domain-containing protein